MPKVKYFSIPSLSYHRLIKFYQHILFKRIKSVMTTLLHVGKISLQKYTVLQFAVYWYFACSTYCWKIIKNANSSRKFFLSKTFINTNVPIFRHRIASKTENRYEPSRNQLQRPFSLFVFWIDVKWNPLGPRRRLLDTCFINTIRLSTWAIYKSS